MVIDADGLNIISRFNMKIDYPYGTIMTPHLMEAARLMSCDITQIKEIYVRVHKILLRNIIVQLF